MSLYTVAMNIYGTLNGFLMGYLLMNLDVTSICNGIPAYTNEMVAAVEC